MTIQNNKPPAKKAVTCSSLTVKGKQCKNHISAKIVDGANDCPVLCGIHAKIASSPKIQEKVLYCQTILKSGTCCKNRIKPLNKQLEGNKSMTICGLHKYFTNKSKRKSNQCIWLDLLYCSSAAEDGLCDKHNRENSSLKHENSTLKSENSSLKHENSTLKSENSSLKHENSTLKSENSSLKHENSSLKHENFSERVWQPNNLNAGNSFTDSDSDSEFDMEQHDIEWAKEQEKLRLEVEQEKERRNKLRQKMMEESKRRSKKNY